MIKFTVLGSGSTGNAVLIATEKTKVLVDAGLSAREVARRLMLVGVDPAALDGILITHEHSDHAGGLRVLLGQVKCPVFISRETHDSYIREKKASNGEWQKRSEAMKGRAAEIRSSEDFRIGDIDFNPFSVPHDAADNFGFVAEHAGARVATLMDFGHVTDLIREKLRGCDGIVVESNHSRDMLKACPVYSWDLKQRILSKTGHLSNEDLADWLATDFDGSARHLVLAHLSQKANEPNLAHLTATMALKQRNGLFKADTEITLSHPKEPTKWFEF
jgi:phosphoribosyl 1,2-cyclic phosphodiesterase